MCQSLFYILLDTAIFVPSDVNKPIFASTLLSRDTNVPYLRHHYYLVTLTSGGQIVTLSRLSDPSAIPEAFVCRTRINI